MKSFEYKLKIMKTRNLLLELIDEILIHEGGNITVKFKFDDAYKDALEYIEMNKEKEAQTYVFEPLFALHYLTNTDNFII